MNKHICPSVFFSIVFSIGILSQCFCQDSQYFTNGSPKVYYYVLPNSTTNILPAPSVPPEWNDPRWGAFWIFSDGHFHVEPDNGNLLGSRKIYYPGLNNPAGGKVKVSTYLSKIYTDTDPPPPTFFISTSPVGTQDETTTFSNFISQQRNIALEVNHEPKFDNELVFVTSYKLNQYAGRGQVFLFFDAIDDNAGGVTPADHTLPAFNYQRSHLPYYFDSTNVAALKDVPSFDASNTTAFKTEFAKVIVKDYGQGEWATTSNNETRLFHALKTLGGYATTTTYFNFMAIVTNSNTDLNALRITDARSDFTRLTKLLGGGYDQSTGFGYLDANRTFAIVDVIDTTLQLVANHDPNRLCFLDVCKCTEKGASKSLPYRARLSLTICNDGEGPVNDMIIQFHDIADEYDCLQIESIKGVGDNYYNDAGNDFTHSAKSFNNLYELKIPDDIDPLDNLKIPGIDDPYTTSKCIEIIFSVNTRQQGVEKLINDYGAIRADVIFKPHPPESAYSEYCDKKESESCCCGNEKGAIKDVAKNIIKNAPECEEACKCGKFDFNLFVKNVWPKLMVSTILPIGLLCMFLYLWKIQRSIRK